jgi:hypothetical protein
MEFLAATGTVLLGIAVLAGLSVFVSATITLGFESQDKSAQVANASV